MRRVYFAYESQLRRKKALGDGSGDLKSNQSTASVVSAFAISRRRHAFGPKSCSLAQRALSMGRQA